LEHAFFYKLSNILWKAIVGTVVVLAIYVSAGRFLMSTVGAYGDDIVRELNSRSPFLIEARDVSGEWHSFTPEIVLTGLRLSVPDSAEPPLELAQGRIAIDVLGSLQTQSLKIYHVSLDQLLLRGELTSEGKLLIAGIGGGSGKFGERLENFLLDIEQISLINNQLFLELPDGEHRLFDLDLALKREGSSRRLDATLFSRTSGTEISLVAHGVGSPAVRERFSGDLFIDVQNSDLESIQKFFPQDRGVQLTGEVDVQAWVAWEQGNPTIDVVLSGSDINIRQSSGNWQIPVDFVSLKTTLMERDERWTGFASDLELRKGNDVLLLPRIQFDMWGNSVRVRAARVPLEPVSAMVLGLDSSSEKIAEVLGTLQPKGQLSSVQLHIADYHQPRVDWELTADFAGLEVQSWRGAPGITGASGYVDLEPGGGLVMFDSHQFSMTFPTVYRDPLRFDDFYGTIHIDWNASDVVLSSSLVHAKGIEGAATALFGLNIPLVKSAVGLEMDLMVAFKDTYPIHRNKYLPYTLNDALLDWINGSIGEGRIEEGAFLWRGSLKKELRDRRTVQLFFNVADTTLNYYPGWPLLSDLEGIVLINDTQVSVWSEKANLYESNVESLSAEAWMNDDFEMMLSITSEVKGDASDGIKVVNESPLNDIVAGAFSDWRLSGGLESRLALQLNLTDKSVRPRLEVHTEWQDVDLLINPGNLPVEALYGELSYSSAKGFDSKDLFGSIWGQALQAQVRQVWQDSDVPVLLPIQPGHYDAAYSSTEIAVETQIDMVDIKQWLDLDILALAKGQAAAELLIKVPVGKAPTVIVETDLLGVSLDLPEPWRKSTKEPAVMRIEVPLGGESGVVTMALDDELNLQVLLSGGDFDGLALGFAQQPKQLNSGTIYIDGHASLVDESQWQKFLNDYVYAPAAPVVNSIPAQETSAAQGATQAPEYAIFLDNLQADTLQLYGQRLSDVTFSIQKESGKTRIEAEAGWVGGELILTEDGDAGKLLIEHLDIEGLGQLSFDSESGASSLEIPDLDVVLADFSHGGQSMGQLEFTLRKKSELTQVDNIVGILAGLTLSAEQSGLMAWSSNGGEPNTRLEMRFGFEDLGETLERLDYQNIIETSSGDFELELVWPGGPQDFAFANARGALLMNVEKGRFLDTPAGASGSLRVVGILNLADIVQRLSLNLSDVFESGIPFHSIEGEVFLHGGSIEVASIDVKGRSSSFQFTGISDIATQSLDGELIATLPLANNLPWVAALAAGLPIAAGVFVVSKVFEKQMNRVSSAVYKIGGDWGNPEVNFDRIFDTSSARKVITSAKRGLPDAAGDPNEPAAPAEAATAP
jgi:uncharacterized protein (TIGR02099 family)